MEQNLGETPACFPTSHNAAFWSVTRRRHGVPNSVASTTTWAMGFGEVCVEILKDTRMGELSCCSPSGNDEKRCEDYCCTAATAEYRKGIDFIDSDPPHRPLTAASTMQGGALAIHEYIKLAELSMSFASKGLRCSHLLFLKAARSLISNLSLCNARLLLVLGCCQ